MRLPQTLARSVVASCLVAALAAGGATAQQAAPSPGFEPQVGQAGKDVIWVRTPDTLVARMLDMAKVTPNDYVIDLGSGDGRTVIAAAKLGAKALGIEYNGDMVELSKRNAEKEGVTGRASFVQGDIFQTDFSQATVLTLFLLSDLNRRLRPTILDMKPGTRVVSNTFDMGEWTPDNQVQAGEGCVSYCRAYFWIVPAKVGGAWRTPQGDLTLEQSFQMLKGALKTETGTTAISDGKMTGDQIAFTAGGAQYTGRVVGDRIEGMRRSGGAETPWQATRG